MQCGGCARPQCLLPFPDDRSLLYTLAVHEGTARTSPPPPQLPVLRLSLNAGIPEHPIYRNNRKGTGPWSRRGSRSSWDVRGNPGVRQIYNSMHIEGWSVI